MATCTFIDNFCAQCEDLFDEVDKISDIIADDLIRDSPDIYPVIFYFRTKVSESDECSVDQITQSVEDNFHWTLGRHIKVYRAISPQTFDGYVTVFYMIDFPSKVEIDQDAMETLFSGEQFNIRDWKVQKPREGQCTSYARLWSFREHFDYLEEVGFDTDQITLALRMPVSVEDALDHALFGGDISWL